MSAALHNVNLLAAFVKLPGPFVKLRRGKAVGIGQVRWRPPGRTFRLGRAAGGPWSSASAWSSGRRVGGPWSSVLAWSSGARAWSSGPVFPVGNGGGPVAGSAWPSRRVRRPAGVSGRGVMRCGTVAGFGPPEAARLGSCQARRR